jgi:hypothetical protein
LSEDEARGDPHQELQEKDSWRLSDVQTAHRSLLLSCKALQGEQVPGAFLSQHQAETAATEFGSTVRIHCIFISHHQQNIFWLVRLQEQQFNRRRAAAMNIRTALSTSSVPAQATAGGSKEKNCPRSISLLQKIQQFRPKATYQQPRPQQQGDNNSSFVQPEGSRMVAPQSRHNHLRKQQSQNTDRVVVDQIVLMGNEQQRNFYNPSLIWKRQRPAPQLPIFQQAGHNQEREAFERESAKMLVVLDNGDQRLKTFTLPKEACTVQDLLDKIGIFVGPGSYIECIENPGSEIDYTVKIENFVFDD